MPTTRRAFLKTAAVGAAAASVGCESAADAPLPTERLGSEPVRVGPDRFDPWVEVDADGLAHNVGEIRRLSEDRPILAVVKNNAYGLGVATTASLLEPMESVAGFAVVKAEAAIALREAGIRKPIFLMALFSESVAAELGYHRITPCLYSDDAVRLTEAMATASGGPVDAHLYLDTGMSRMGIPYHRALPWIGDVAASGSVRIGGVFTGFTEDPEYDREQLGRMLSVTEAAADAGIDLGVRHAASSSAVFEFAESHLDLVRPGMALYGGYPNDPALQREKAALRSAVRLKARVVRVERLREGDSVSYGRNYVASEPTWVATLPVGHTDGYPRNAVNGGRVSIGSKSYPVIGAVSASHTIVEVGPEPEVAVGDVATLLGSHTPEVDPNHLSAETGTSVYDVFMHLNPTLPRVVT